MFDVKLLDVTSVVYDVPFGKGRQFGSNLNPVLDAVLGGWNECHQYRQYRLTGQRQLQPFLQQRRYRHQPERRLSRRRPPAAQRLRRRSQPERGESLLTYFAGYTFTTPSPNSPFGNLGRNAFRAPGLERWDLGVDKNFLIREGISSVPQ